MKRSVRLNMKLNTSKFRFWNFYVIFIFIYFRTEYEDSCKTVYDQQCETKYDTKCETKYEVSFSAYFYCFEQ